MSGSHDPTQHPSSTGRTGSRPGTTASGHPPHLQYLEWPGSQRWEANCLLAEPVIGHLSEPLHGVLSILHARNQSKKSPTVPWATTFPSPRLPVGGACLAQHCQSSQHRESRPDPGPRCSLAQGLGSKPQPGPKRGREQVCPAGSVLQCGWHSEVRAGEEPLLSLREYRDTPGTVSLPRPLPCCSSV